MAARRIPQATVAALVLLVVSTVAVVTLVLARGGLSMPPAGEGGLPTPTTDAVASSSPDALPTSTAVASPSSAGASLAPAPRVTSSAIGDHYALLELCPDRPACYIYVVRAGDNLLSIANYFGVIYATILELNPSIRDPALIKKGQRIILPPPTR
jgi:nucleoid-associated protein YgaU